MIIKITGTAFILAALIYSSLLIVESFLYVSNCCFQTHAHRGATTKEPVDLLNQKFLHPFYLFSLPWKQKHYSLTQDGEALMSIITEGFVGPGPSSSFRKNRKLAFILGGSTAMGVGASSLSKTVSSQLNLLQDKFFFVNAAVPSFVSHQEFLRLAKELIHFRPSLIIAINGINDAAVSVINEILDYPPGTPESFVDIENWVNDIRSTKNFFFSKGH